MAVCLSQGGFTKYLKYIPAHCKDNGILIRSGSGRFEDLLTPRCQSLPSLTFAGPKIIIDLENLANRVLGPTECLTHNLL